MSWAVMSGMPDQSKTQLESKDLEKGENPVGPREATHPSWARLSRSQTSNPNHVPGSLPARTPTADKASPVTDGPPTEYHGKGFQSLPWVIRGHVVSMLGEFFGTFSFLFLAFSATQTAVNGDYPPPWFPAQSAEMLMYVALAFGFSLAVNAWAFFRVSGGLFNPAVNLALCLVGALTWTRGALLFVAQLLGALVAAGLVSAMFPGDLSVETTLGATTNVAQGFFIEVFVTAQFILVILMLAAEKHEGRFLAPIGIGITLFVAGLSTVAYTGCSLNPVRSFAPAAIYWLGPLLGAAVATLIYKLLKFLEYETAGPDSVDPVPLAVHLLRQPTRRPTSTPGQAVEPIITLGHRPKGESDDETYQDAREWALNDDLRRRTTGFGQGLILSEAQGTTKKKRITAD